jgi:hypothetical protein
MITSLSIEREKSNYMMSINLSLTLSNRDKEHAITSILDIDSDKNFIARTLLLDSR